MEEIACNLKKMNEKLGLLNPVCSLRAKNAHFTLGKNIHTLLKFS